MAIQTSQVMHILPHFPPEPIPLVCQYLLWGDTHWPVARTEGTSKLRSNFEKGYAEVLKVSILDVVFFQKTLLKKPHINVIFLKEDLLFEKDF